jgi:DNA-binding Lrp family transcriptional regulator
MVPGWLDELEQEMARCLTGGCRLSPRELADALGVSEEAAIQRIVLLASSGRLRIEAVSLAATPTRWTATERLSAAA